MARLRFRHSGSLLAIARIQHALTSRLGRFDVEEKEVKFTSQKVGCLLLKTVRLRRTGVYRIAATGMIVKGWPTLLDESLFLETVAARAYSWAYLIVFCRFFKCSTVPISVHPSKRGSWGYRWGTSLVSLAKIRPELSAMNIKHPVFP